MVKIFDSFIIGDKTLLVSNLGGLTIYENILISERFYQKNLDKPEKLDKEDIDIRIKAVNYSKAKKLALLNVIYSNNEVYLYDLNKILNGEEMKEKEEDIVNKDQKEEDKEKKEGNEVNKISLVKKFKSIILKTQDRLTCLDSQILNN